MKDSEGAQGLHGDLLALLQGTLQLEILPLIFSPCVFYYIHRGGTEDIISYFTLMSSEIHYYDIIEKMGSWTLMSSEV